LSSTCNSTLFFHPDAIFFIIVFDFAGGLRMKKAPILQRPVGLILFLLILLPLAACHPEPVMPQDARVLIINPAAESTISSNTITIRTFVERFDLVDKTGQKSSPGEGHIVYYMDVTPPMEQGNSALSADGTYVISTDTSYTWNNVQPGMHVFWVQLVNNDNTPLEPQQAVRVYVTVK
jgi:hypothetical protein